MKIGIFVLAALFALAVGPPVMTGQSHYGYLVFGAGGTTIVMLGLIAAVIVIAFVATGKAFYAGDRLGSWRSRQVLTVKSKMFMMIDGGLARLRDMFAGPFKASRQQCALGAAAS